MKKFLYILLLLGLNYNFFAQQTDEFGALPQNYGIVHEPAKGYSYLSFRLMDLYKGILGSRIPKTVYEERMMKRMLRTRLTKQEYRAVLKKDVLGQQLTLLENFYYYSARRKLERRAKLVIDFSQDTSKLSRKAQEAVFTPAEKMVLKKAKDSTQELTDKEKRILKRALRKQRRLEREKQRYTITDSEKALLKKARTDTAKLTLSDRFKLLKIRAKQKRIERRKLEQAAASGAWTPKKVKGSKRLWFRLRFGSMMRPSSYVRKLERYKKRYELSVEEKQVLAKASNSVPLTFREKIIYRRAKTKEWKYKHKVEKLKKRYFLKLQDRQTRKRLRQQERQLKRKQRKALRKQRWQNFKKYVQSLF